MTDKRRSNIEQFQTKCVVFRCALALSFWVGIGAVAAPVGTAFTYQGQLKQDGVPMDGVVGLRFWLYDGPDPRLITLIAGPVALTTPVGARRVDVTTTAEMAGAALSACADAHVLIMAAAVADFRPARVADQKLKKTAVPQVELEKTLDILAAVAEQREAARKPEVVVGFAAESQNLIENAREKVLRKRLSLIVANDISARDAGFAVDTNRVTVIDAGGGVEQLPLMTKAQVADVVLERIEKLLA